MNPTQTTRPTMEHPTPIGEPSAGSNTPAPTTDVTASRRDPSGRDLTSPQAITGSTPIVAAPAGTETGRDQCRIETPTTCVSATDIPGDHGATDAQDEDVAGEPNQSTAIQPPIPNVGPPSADDHPRTAKERTVPRAEPPSGGLLGLIDEAVEADPAFLSLIADIVDDLERVRIANENRLRHLTRDKEDSDGEVRGLGLDVRNPHVRRVAAVVDQVKVAEHDAVLALQNLMRKHPLGPWVKATKGVGEKQAARLLGTIGDPYIRPELTRSDDTVEPSRPRTVSELWAYAGLHVLPADQRGVDAHTAVVGGSKTGSHPDQLSPDAQSSCVGVAPKRQKGQRANWSTVAKTRAYLVAEGVVKATIRKLPGVDDGGGYDFAHREASTPLGRVYLDTRAKYADAIHKVPCVRCGPSGKPAPAGSPLSDGHKHARAMRAVSKEVLKELWRESKRLHEEVSNG